MLNKINKSKTEGFTIIETLIVLAVAGLIMLIVFLAVPALQRSTRNTQRKNDISAIASAIANYINNNGGTLPNTTSGSGTSVLIGCTAGGTGLQATGCNAGNTEPAKLGYYTPSSVTFVSAAPTSPFTNTTAVEIVNGYTCNSTNTGLGGQSARTAAILYATENGSSTGNAQCQEQ